MTDRDAFDPNGELEGLYHAYPPEGPLKRRARIERERAEEAKEREWVRALATATDLIDRLLPSNHERGEPAAKYKTSSETQAIVAHLKRLGYTPTVTVETEPEEEGSEYCHTITVQGPYLFRVGGRYRRKDIPDGALVSVWGGPERTWLEVRLANLAIIVGLKYPDRPYTYWAAHQREGRKWESHCSNRETIIALGLSGSESASDIEALVAKYNARSKEPK